MLLPLLSSSVHAEVFKCQLESDKTVYQSTPCQSALKQKALEIQESDPRKTAEAEAKLKAWKEDFAKREEARIKAEKEQKAELDRKASVEALQKSAEYQQRQAYEQKRQADALEQQNRQNQEQQYLFYPPLGYPPFPVHAPHRNDVKEKPATDTRQPGRTDTKSGKDSHPDSGGSKIIFKWK